MRFHHERLIERPTLDYCDSGSPLACSFIGTALAIGLAAAGAAGSIGSAAIASHGAGKAADAQAAAADSAAQLQHQDAQDALQFNKDVYANDQKNIAPWLQTGTAALGNLSSLLGVSGDSSAPGYGSLLKPYGETWQAPTGVTEQNDPGYQFRIQQGLDAIQRSAAAKGNILTGGTAKDLNDYAQNSASNEYSNVYNRAFNDYTTRYNQYQADNANTFNRLGSLAGTGQTAANQLAGSGSTAANNTSNILLTSGQQIGNDYQNAGAARASGYAAGANAYGGAFGNIGNNLTSLLLLSKLGKS
jgi:hypothetical protein